MAKYNTLNVKLSNSQLIIKIRNKKWSYVTLNLPSNVTFNCNDETNFPHKSLFTNTQDSKIRKTFPNVSSANIKLSKSQDGTVRMISKKTPRTITKNWFAFNEKCTQTIS